MWFKCSPLPEGSRWLCLGCACMLNGLVNCSRVTAQSHRSLFFLKCKSASLSSNCLLIYTGFVEDECLKNLLHFTFLKCAFQKDSRYPTMLSPKCCQTIILSRLCVLYNLETEKHAFKWGEKKEKKFKDSIMFNFFSPSSSIHLMKENYSKWGQK